MRAEEPNRADFEAVTFDAAGTLFRLVERVGETYSRIGRIHGWNLGAAHLETGFRLAWKSAPPLGRWPGTETLGPDDRERAWWRHMVEDTFRMAETLESSPAGSNPARVDGELFDALFRHYENGSAWQLYPETKTVLSSLSALGKRLAVVSNFDRRFRRVAADLGILESFEIVILSGEIGISKPAPGIFHAAVEQLGCPAAQTVHVGDDPVTDWEGARSAGLRVFELKRPGGSLSDLK